MKNTRKTCGDCKYFSSYVAIYEDPMEDHENGGCTVEKEHPYPQTSYDTSACINWRPEK